MNEKKNPMAGLLSEENIAKLRSHPKTAHFFLQNDFVIMLGLIKTNPNLMSIMLQESRFSECLIVLLGFDFIKSPGDEVSSKHETKTIHPNPHHLHSEAKKEEKNPRKSH